MNQTIALENKIQKVALIHSLLELMKARLTALVLVTTLVGFLLASGGTVEWITLFWTLVGTACAAGGANAFNQWMEAERDSRMKRTCERPIPVGRMKKSEAFWWASSLSISGFLILGFFTNFLTAGQAAFVILFYVLVYTPLKTRSSLCTLAGAVCGAIPPMMGWTAVTGTLDYGAWILGAILFVWQIPHFLALAWLYREDYSRGGFRMLPVHDQDGRLTCHLAVLYSLALIPLGLVVTITGLAGWIYAFGSVLLGGVMVTAGVFFTFRRLDIDARRLFIASIIYLPLLLGLMVADRGV